MSKHTQGPWTIRSEPDEPNAGGRYVKHYIEPTIADVFYTNETGEANARLIAAAPELLEALKLAREALTSKAWDANSHYVKSGDYMHDQKIICAAIAKAE